MTKADNGTLTLQEQPNNIAVTVATDASTTVTTFAPGALGDLKTGDIVAVQGDKTGDTAYTATTIFALNGFGGGNGGAGQGQGGRKCRRDRTSREPRRRRAGPRQRGRWRRQRTGGQVRRWRWWIARRSERADRADHDNRQRHADVQGFDGSTTTVATNASTTVRKQTPGKASDIKVGDTVIVQGDKVSDQAYTARMIIDQGVGA